MKDDMTTTIYQHIYDNLLKHSWMRYDRHKAIKEMLQEKYVGVDWETLPDIAHDWISYDRVFRLVQSENEDVRPHDWEEKKKVREQSYEINVLGREAGFKQLTKEEQYELFEPKR